MPLDWFFNRSHRKETFFFWLLKDLFHSVLGFIINSILGFSFLLAKKKNYSLCHKIVVNASQLVPHRRLVIASFSERGALADGGWTET